MKYIKKKLKARIAKVFSRFDRRCRFYDLSKIKPSLRESRNDIIQFYSSANNIGNYLPVLGIRKMISMDTDTWCMHDENVDFDFINHSYKGIIIGGAGLLNKCFQPFWEIMGKECKLPVIIWGVGGCFQDGQNKTNIDINIAKKVLNKCDLINLRDNITANFYGLSDVHFSPCPTIAYLDDFKTKETFKRRILFSSHEQSVRQSETQSIRSVIKGVDKSYKYTNNVQRFRLGLDDILRNFYCSSRIVVTTRLHGAIIAYGLKIPYVAIPRDEKVRAFNRLYSNGITVEHISDLEEVLLNKEVKLTKSVRLDLVYEFANRVRDWIRTLS